MSRAIHVPRACRGVRSLLNPSLRRHAVCAARKEDLEPDWQDFFDSIDSDDLGLEGLFDEQPPPKAEQLRLGSCYGCGVELQMKDPAHPGFVEERLYDQKKQHKQHHSILCVRHVAALIIRVQSAFLHCHATNLIYLISHDRDGEP